MWQKSLLSLFVGAAAAAAIGCGGPMGGGRAGANATDPQVIRVTDDSFRVVMPTRQDMPLGSCADDEGTILNIGTCATQKEALKLAASDGQLRHGQLRMYSTTLSIDGKLGGSVPVVKGEASVKSNSHVMVVEWSRTRVQSLSSTNAVTRYPAVTDADVGVAIRLIIEISSTDAAASIDSNFGYASISAKLAAGQVNARIYYDLVGTQDKLISAMGSTTQVKTLDQFAKCENTFYEAIRVISLALDRFQRHEPLTKPDDVKEAAPTSELNGTVEAPKHFDFGVVSYRIAGVRNDWGPDQFAHRLGYLSGLKRLAASEPCHKAASSKSLGDDDAKRSGVVDAYKHFAKECGSDVPPKAAVDKVKEALDEMGSEAGVAKAKPAGK